ncbi:MAG: hypothetical protein JWO78_1921 [Micavibrio sp.]|nr:hypothetical protein [Micavibrio sp.]
MPLENTANINQTFDGVANLGGKAPMSIAFEAAHDNIDPSLAQLKRDAKAGNLQSFGPNPGLAANVFPVLAAATPVRDTVAPVAPKLDNTQKLTN